jgi:predicted PurR-regulated permease PerM
MRPALRIEISSRTLVRILLTVAAVWLWLRLWQMVLLFVIGAFIAVGLDPLVTWLDARRFYRRFSAPTVVIFLAALLVGFAYLAGSSLIEQLGLLGSQLEQAREEIARRTPQKLLELWPKGQGLQSAELLSPAREYALDREAPKARRFCGQGCPSDTWNVTARRSNPFAANHVTNS